MDRTQLERTSKVNTFRDLFSCCLAFALFFVFYDTLQAGSMGTSEPVVVRVTGVDPGTGQGRTDEFVVPVKSDNSFALVDASSRGTLWDLNGLTVRGNIDPFTSLNYAVTNNAAVTLQFTVSIVLPIAPQLPATLHGGSVGGTLTDANNNGVATVATVGGGVPFYQGQIDGFTVLSIYPDPYSLSVAFAGQTINVPAMNVGLPGPTLPSGPAFATIGIINRFSLTAGDQFSGNSFFVVVPVPEPSTLALLGLCIMGLAGRRR